jgi:hypothetical protein
MPANGAHGVSLRPRKGRHHHAAAVSAGAACLSCIGLVPAVAPGGGVGAPIWTNARAPISSKASPPKMSAGPSAGLMSNASPCGSRFQWRKQRRLFDGYVRLQRRLGFKRRIPAGIVPHLGSQWWCLTRHTLSAILETPTAPRLTDISAGSGFRMKAISRRWCGRCRPMSKAGR